MENTPYGNMRVYYTGADARFRSITPKHYEFFYGWRGHVSAEQIAEAVEVWSANASELSYGRGSGASSASGSAGTNRVDLCSVSLKPDTAYQLVVEASAAPGLQLDIVDGRNNQLLKQTLEPDQQDRQHVEAIFRTFEDGRITVTARLAKHDLPSSLSVNRVSIREIAELSARKQFIDDPSDSSIH